MRRLLALLVLVPFATMVVLSCDDPPTAPEQAQAATTPQESSTPQAAKKPPFEAPAVLSGAVIVKQTVSITGTGMGWPKVYCPEGKFPVSGGFNMYDFGDLMFGDWRLIANGPITTSSGSGWVVGIQMLCENPCSGTEDDFTLEIYAACVDADFAD